MALAPRLGTSKDFRGEPTVIENEGNYAEIHGEGQPLVLLHGSLGMTGMLVIITSSA